MHSQSLAAMLMGLATAVAAYVSVSLLLSCAVALPIHLWASAATTAVQRPLASGLTSARSHPPVLEGRLPTAPSRQPHPLASASVGAIAAPHRQGIPAAGLLATIFGTAVLAFWRLHTPSRSPMAALAITGNNPDDFLKNVKAQFDSAKSQADDVVKGQFDAAQSQVQSAQDQVQDKVQGLQKKMEGAKEEVVDKSKAAWDATTSKAKEEFEAAKAQVQVAQNKIQSLQKQVEEATAEMRPKVQAELDKSKAAFENANSKVKEMARTLAE